MNRDGGRPLPEEEVDSEEKILEALRESPWEQGQKKTESQTRLRAPVVCEWCLMFAALPGKPRCGGEICNESKGAGK